MDTDSPSKPKAKRIGAGKPGPGRPPGVPNRLTGDLRDAFATGLRDEFPHFLESLKKLRRSPARHVALYLRGTRFVMPELASVQMTAQLLPLNVKTATDEQLEALIASAGRVIDVESAEAAPEPALAALPPGDAAEGGAGSAAAAESPTVAQEPLPAIEAQRASEPISPAPARLQAAAEPDLMAALASIPISPPTADDIELDRIAKMRLEAERAERRQAWDTNCAAWDAKMRGDC